MDFYIIAEVKEVEDKYVAYDIKTGEEISEPITYIIRRRAFENKKYIGKIMTREGNPKWVSVMPTRVPKDYEPADMPSIDPVEVFANETPKIVDGIALPTQAEVREAVATAHKTVPVDLVIDPLNWRLAVHGAYKGDNILLLGHSGCGKTKTARSLAEAYDRPFFRFNMGAMQDARASLIGNTHYATEKGTFFAGSEFVKAIQTPFAVILIDEYTRISPDAENIMLTVLDRDQRYLRIDEDPETPTIKVAPGVVFVATANVGTEYTSTRTLDRATMDRFHTLVELSILTRSQEVKLARQLFPELNRNYIDAFVDVAMYTRDDVKSDNPKLSTIISTRSIHDQCQLALGGFRFSEVMKAKVFCLYDNEGAPDSERGELMQKAQEKSNLDNEDPLMVVQEKIRQERAQRTSGKKKNMFDVNEDAMGM